MSATLAQLLDQLRACTRTRTVVPSREAAEQAITALGHLARATAHLSSDGVDTRLSSPSQQDRAAALVEHCSVAARAWLPAPGPLPDLAGAAADLTARWAPRLSPAQRWTIVVAIAEAAVDTSALAQRHGPYAANRALAAALNAGLALEQHAATDPPGPVAAAILDRPVPSVRLDLSLAPVRVVAEAAASLSGSVRIALADRNLTLADALATAAVARYAALQAVTVASEMIGTAGTAAAQANAMTWTSAANAWLAVQLAYAPFDDGTKHAKPRPDNPVRQWALRLFDALQQLPREPGPNGTLRPEEDIARQAIALRDVATHLPDLAEHLCGAVDSWVERGCLLAPARRLASFELINQADVPHEPVALVTAADLAEVRTALEDARQLSTGLAAHLDRVASQPGDYPNLAAAYRRAVGELHPAGADRRARSAPRRLALDPPHQWGFVRLPRAAAPPRSR